MNREEFIALWIRLLEGEEEGFTKAGHEYHGRVLACHHFGKQELYYLTDKLYPKGRD